MSMEKPKATKPVDKVADATEQINETTASFRNILLRIDLPSSIQDNDIVPKSGYESLETLGLKEKIQNLVLKEKRDRKGKRFFEPQNFKFTDTAIKAIESGIRKALGPESTFELSILSDDDTIGAAESQLEKAKISNIYELNLKNRSIRLERTNVEQAA